MADSNKLDDCVIVNAIMCNRTACDYIRSHLDQWLQEKAPMSKIVEELQTQPDCNVFKSPAPIFGRPKSFRLGKSIGRYLFGVAVDTKGKISLCLSSSIDSFTATNGTWLVYTSSDSCYQVTSYYYC